MTKPKIILLTGFAAAGKSTIAKKYIANHSMAMAIEADNLVDNIGDWINHREEIRYITFELTKAMLRTYLPFRHDAILPYVITDATEAEAFEEIARQCDADYYEFALQNDHDAAVARLLERGTWGESTSPPLTNKDLPIIEDLYSKVEAAIALRPNLVRIDLHGQNPDDTYAKIIDNLKLRR